MSLKNKNDGNKYSIFFFNFFFNILIIFHIFILYVDIYGCLHIFMLYVSKQK